MIDTLFSGLIHGGAYALVAVGVSLIFGVTNVVNFAQGSLVAVGMMVAWYFGSVLGWPIIPVALVVTVITAILGWLINAGVIAPLEGASRLPHCLPPSVSVRFSTTACSSSSVRVPVRFRNCCPPIICNSPVCVSAPLTLS